MSISVSKNIFAEEKIEPDRCANCSVEFKGTRRKCTKMKTIVKGMTSNSLAFCDMNVIDVFSDVYAISWDCIANSFYQANLLQGLDEKILSYANGSLEMAICDQCMPRLASIYKACKSFEARSKPDSILNRVREINKNILKDYSKVETTDVADGIFPEIHSEVNESEETTTNSVDEMEEDNKVEIKYEIDPHQCFEFEESDQMVECEDETNCQIPITFIIANSSRKQTIQPRTMENDLLLYNEDFGDPLMQPNLQEVSNSHKPTRAMSNIPSVATSSKVKEVKLEKRNAGDGAKGIMMEALRTKGTSKEGIQRVLSSLSDSTWRQYNGSLRKWREFCGGKGYEIFKPSSKSLLAFLKHLHDHGTRFSAMNTAQAAVSFLSMHTSGYSLGESLSIKEFRKDLLRPKTLSRALTWDPSPVLNYLSSLEPIENLNISDLTLKTFGLFSLATAHRMSTAAAISESTIKKLTNGIRIPLIPTDSKRSGPKLKQKCIFLPILKNCPTICPARCLLEYLRRTQPHRCGSQKLFISFVSPYQNVTPSTLLRWQKTIIVKSGLDKTVFLPGCLKYASSDVLTQKGIPIKKIRAKNTKTSN